MSTEETNLTETHLSDAQLERIAESFENLNSRLERYDKTLTNTLLVLSIVSVIFLAGAGLASILY
tara:strand:- start:66 stop:260 length:195 start_codon:yes stop_codon:yes gene_type:complete